MMDMFLQISVFLWILFGSLPSSAKPDASLGNGYPSLCEFVLRNVCFNFVGGSRTWSQSRSSCELRGGELLQVLNKQTRNYLNNIPGEKNISHLTFWLGKGIHGRDMEPAIINIGISKGNCTYMKLNPLELIGTSDCNQRRGFLCTHNVGFSSNAKETKASSDPFKVPRYKRNAVIDNIAETLRILDDKFYEMETTPREPSDDSRDSVIQKLMYALQQLTPDLAMQNKEIINNILKFANGILLLSEKKCDIEYNPNPTDLHDKIFELFRQASLLLIGTEQYVVEYPQGTIYHRSYEQSSFDNAVIGSVSKGEYVIFPPLSAMQDQLEGVGNVIAELMTISENTHPSEENITLPLFNVSIGDGNKHIGLKNLPEMIELFIPNPKSSLQTSEVVFSGQNKRAVITVNVTDPHAAIMFTIEPSSNVSLAVLLSEGSPPNSSFAGNKSILSQAGGYQFMITPEKFKGEPGVWYVDIRLHNSVWETGLYLRVSSFRSKCLFLDTSLDQWSTDGCQVGEKSNMNQTHCLCNHLTLFGSSFFVMPNHVDISRTPELFATVNENYVVLALLCAFFGLYLITLLWACYADRRALSRRKMTLLQDNHPGALYNYLVSVQTGNRKNAGTTAEVTVKLIGSEAESDTYNLKDSDKPVFERGGVDIFLLATPFPLGEVQSIRLQHDNSGSHPSWYINKVMVEDLQTRHVVHFLCGCWLSNDRGDNMIKKTFSAAQRNEIDSFRNIFQSRTSTGFRDQHIWVSILDPPSRSPFTRAQRVSCCMSLLLCTMAINIAFWNIPVDESSPVLFSIGSLKISRQELMVGIQSGLLMFPINILIITIFRSIKPRLVSKSKKDDPEENSKPPAATLSAVLKDTEDVLYALSKSPKNKISEIGTLENSADIPPALEKVNGFIQLMQGQMESAPHWVYCSKFLLAGLSHLIMNLERLGESNFPTPHQYKETLKTVSLLLSKAEMVLTSHLTGCPPPVKKKKVTSMLGCWLPWWCVFLGWFLLLSISGVSTFFTLLYGFQYGKDKSVKWVMSLGLSLFQSIFILQPLKVIGIAVFFALLLKPVTTEETDEVEQVMTEQWKRCKHYSGRATL